VVLESSGPIGRIEYIKLWNRKEKGVPFMSLGMVRGVAVLLTGIFFYLVMIFPLNYDRTRSVQKQTSFEGNKSPKKHHLTQAQKTVPMMSQMSH